MLKKLYRFCGNNYLTLKMFKNLVRPHLYHKVIKNTLCNMSGRYTPSSAILGMTYNCQCKCVHCSAGSYKKDVRTELSNDRWMRILDDIDELGVPRINLTGGEALLRKDIFDLISYASDKFVVILESNGLLLSPETALRLKRAKISCVAVSVDTTNGAEHDSLRGVKECFNSAMEGIRNLRRAGVPCIMSTYIPVEKANIRYIQDFMALAKANRVLAVRILPPRPVGSFSCNTSSLLDKKAENLIRNSADPFIAYFNGMPAPSMCGIFTRSTFYISPYGEVQPCPYMPLSFGNIKNADLPELLKLMWNNDIFNDFGKKCLVLNTKFRETYLDNLREYPAEVRGKQK